MALQFWLRVLDGALRARGIRRRRVRTANGYELSYHESGRGRDGPTVVLLHGLASSSLAWARVIPRIGKRHHVIALDLPGFGYSPRPPGRAFVKISEAVEAVEGFLAAGVTSGRVALVGNSLGGWVAAKVARRLPARLAQLVLVNNAGVLTPNIDEQRKRLNVRTREDVRTFWERMWHKVPSFYLFFWRDYIDHMQDSMVTGLLDAVGEEDFVNHDLAELRVPTTIIWGRSDRFLPAESVDLMVQELKATQVYWMPRTGHIPQLESPQLFSEILLGVLRRDSMPIGPKPA